MNLATLNLHKQMLKKALRELDFIKINCCSCDNYAGGNCKKFGAAPPDEWLTGPAPVDCEHWEYDEIPF